MSSGSAPSSRRVSKKPEKSTSVKSKKADARLSKTGKVSKSVQKSKQKSVSLKKPKSEDKSADRSASRRPKRGKNYITPKKKNPQSLVCNTANSRSLKADSDKSALKNKKGPASTVTANVSNRSTKSSGIASCQAPPADKSCVVDNNSQQKNSGIAMPVEPIQANRTLRALWMSAGRASARRRLLIVMRSAERVDRVFGPKWKDTEMSWGWVMPSDQNIGPSLRAIAATGYSFENDSPITEIGFRDVL
ncbi:unnamed protein product, partial [Mesorhabditis spiculigera]